MSDSKKPGLLEGLLEGFDPSSRSEEEDSPELEEAKSLLDSLELSIEGRFGLAGWLVGEAIKSSFISALEDDSPAE